MYQHDPILKLSDLVRETAFAIHCYHGPGHLEKIYENCLVHRLNMQKILAAQQFSIQIKDEDGTLLGDFRADILVEKKLILELKACKTLAEEHVAQTLGYLKGTGLRHALLINFGAPRLQIKKLIL